jgi:MoaA/NifB/PqqE/SkfB family radical SAM enzyme
MFLARKAQMKLWSQLNYAPFPSTIFLVVNNRCNLFCRMCDVGRTNRERQRPGETDATFSRNLITRDELPVEAWKNQVEVDFTPLDDCSNLILPNKDASSWIELQI